jgi:GABA(A) receptor-associated protein
MKPFKQRFDTKARTLEAERIISKYPTRIPIIVEKSPACNTLEALDREKFLVPADMTVAEFYFVIRKRMQRLNPNEALFFFVGDHTMAKPSNTLRQMYDQHKDEDGFVYMMYTGENTFG